jgi:transposase
MKPRKNRPQEELFPFVEMEKLIPENHILRLIHRYVDFSFIHELVDHTYSETTGRPATDPELLIRIVLLGYLYNLSENKLFEELRMHAAFRWFCNLGFYDKVPDRSTLNKVRNHRWSRDGIFEQIMNAIVLQCVEAGLVSGRHVAVDGTKIQANAAIKSLEPIVVEVELDDYLEQLRLKNDDDAKPDDTHPEDKNFRGKKLSNTTHRSATDPDARLYRKSKGQDASLSYIGNNLIDTKSRVILATKVVQPGLASETDAAVAMLDTLAQSGIRLPIETVSADKGYGSTTFIRAMLDRGITPHAPLLADAAYEPVPSWHRKTTRPDIYRNRLQKIKDVSTRNRARDSMKTREYTLSQKLRKRVEHVFAEAKQWHGLDRARSRGIASMQQQAYLTAIVQNIKRLVSHCRRTTTNAGMCMHIKDPVRRIWHIWQSHLTQTMVNTTDTRYYTSDFSRYSLHSAF